MKLNPPMFTLALLFLANHALGCGDHYEVQAKKGDPVIHPSFNGYKLKQFPDISTNYDSNNPNHRGIFTWSTNSLTDQSEYALTFDDGPHPSNTPRLLDILKYYNVKATFFVMGSLVQVYPKIIERMINEGHTVASHDWRHDNSNNETESQFKRGVRDSILAIKKYSKQKEVYYRFPYGAYARATGYHHFNALKEVSNELFAENCINFAFWEIDTSDWVQGMTPENINETFWANHRGGKAWRFRRQDNRYVKEAYSIKKPRRGGVILMHDIHKRTVDAVEIILREASSQNIDFVLLKDVEEFSFSTKNCQIML